MRTAIESERRVSLPLLTDFSRLDVTPKELIRCADDAREASSGVSEHVLQRRVRDELDRRRATYGTEVFNRERRTIEGVESAGGADELSDRT